MSSLRSQKRTRAKAIVDILRSKGFRASTPHELGQCLESYLECCGGVLLIAFFDGKFSDDLVIKVTTDIGGCEDVLYSPRGLYVIGGTDEEAAERVLKKAEFVSATQRAFRS